MATKKQIAANQRNSKNSTGPRSLSGKRHSRRNSLRHGLTAETVIEVHEDAAEYKALQRAITADYRPCCNFEIELINRLVSLLWRLRRAVAIESGLLSIQRHTLKKRQERRLGDRLKVFYDYIPALTPSDHIAAGQRQYDAESDESLELHQDTKVEKVCDDSTVAYTFLETLRANGKIFERLGRYEMRLWRQTVQIILLLNAINRGSHWRANERTMNYLNLTSTPRTSQSIRWPPSAPFSRE